MSEEKVDIPAEDETAANFTATDPQNPAGSEADTLSGERDTRSEIDTQTTSLFVARKKAQPASPKLLLLSLTVLTVFAVNGAYYLWMDDPQPVAELPEATTVLAEKIEAIKAGTTDTLQVTEVAITDDHLSALAGLDGIRQLLIDEGVVTDASVVLIASLPNLEHLRLRDSPLTDVSLQELSKCGTLRILNLPQAEVTPEGIRTLSSLNELRQIRIGGNGSVDLSRAVATLSPLRVVHLINVPVTDEGLKELSKLPHLESLYLDGPRVTEAGWEWLFENHPELHVHINQRHHDRDPRHHYHTSEDPNESPDKPEIDWIPGKGPAEAVRAAEKAEAEAAGETASSSGGNDP